MILYKSQLKVQKSVYVSGAPPPAGNNYLTPIASNYDYTGRAPAVQAPPLPSRDAIEPPVKPGYEGLTPGREASTVYDELQGGTSFNNQSYAR